MVYQLSWKIKCQSQTLYRTVIVLFNQDSFSRVDKERKTGLHAFPKDDSLNVTVEECLEFELAYQDVAVLHVKYCIWWRIKRIFLLKIWFKISMHLMRQVLDKDTWLSAEIC